MNLKHYTLSGVFSVFAVTGTILAPLTINASEQGVEELTRGPVHEAFAASMSKDPEPGMIVKAAPPSLIREEPPDQRPVGDNVSWIPGYWGWDDDGSDFIWISGVWRNMPPGRQWTPGYWEEAENQWQWTSGYWADSVSDEVIYQPKPPKSLESGPNISAPSRSHIWISGSWVNREDRYAWRPGYWDEGQQNWGWSPAHYQWTRRGYVFVDGYWDYDVPRRGVVFAPVRFNRSYYNRENYVYTPLVVIALNVFAEHLFVRPRYGQYYFGDYYASRYQRDGYFSSFTYRSGPGGYDPLYAQARWKHRDESGWERGRRSQFDYYRNNEKERPARTWADMQSQQVSKKQDKRQNSQYAQSLSQYAKGDKDQRFQAVNAEDRGKISEQGKQLQDGIQQRRQIENRQEDQAKEGPDKRIVVKREKVTRSPLAGKAPSQLSEKDSPPAPQQRKVEERPEQKKQETSPRAEKSEKDRTDRPSAPAKPGEKGNKDVPRPQTKSEPKKDAKEPTLPQSSPKLEPSRKPKPEAQKPQVPEQAKPQQPKNPEPKQQRIVPEKSPPKQAPENGKKAATERRPSKEEAKKKGADPADEKPKK